MTEATFLPSELQKFLSLDRPLALLIRGGPGTGRSSLARAVLHQIAGNVRILSDEGPAGAPRWTGVSPQHSVEYQPIEDLFVARSRPHAVSLAPPVAEEKPAGPEPLQAIVVDGWDTLVEHYLGRGRRAAGADGIDSERALFDHWAGSCQRFIAVAGLGRTSSLEYLSDGIVEVTQVYADERSERWLRIVKLRSVEMARTGYPFTLTSGEFRSFPPLPRVDALRAFAAPDHAPDDASIWPGSTDYSRAFGRFRAGELTIVEADRLASTDVQMFLMTPVLMQMIEFGGRMVFVPPPTLFPGELWRRARELIPPEQLGPLLNRAADRLRVLSHLGSEDDDPEFGKLLYPLRFASGDVTMMSAAPERSESYDRTTAADSTVPRFPGLRDFLEAGSSKEVNLELVFVDGLTAAARVIGSNYTPAALASVIQRDLNSHRSHVIFVGSENHPLLSEMYPLASTHLKLATRQGRIFVRGIRPWTGNYVLSLRDRSGPREPYRLVPVS